MSRVTGLSSLPRPLPSPLYVILDPAQAKGRPLIPLLSGLLKGGAATIQLRAKEMSPNELFQFATEVRNHTRSPQCLFIVNDRVDIALASQADGVHLGQEDLPLRVARKLMGDKIVGISTHDVAQAIEAERDGADYIGFGPIFETATKQTGYAARGLSALREVRSAVKIPIVAIGGIAEENVTQVWDAGADAAAMISELMAAEDLPEKVRKILSLYRAP